MFFRGYKKGGGAINEGLQIYREHTLIADIDVPVGFKVLGLINGYIYASGEIDEDAGEIYVYRFKINNNV
jgi:hypothetical protein